MLRVFKFITLYSNWNVSCPRPQLIFILFTRRCSVSFLSPLVFRIPAWKTLLTVTLWFRTGSCCSDHAEFMKAYGRELPLYFILVCGVSSSGALTLAENTHLFWYMLGQSCYFRSFVAVLYCDSTIMWFSYLVFLNFTYRVGNKLYWSENLFF